MEQQTTVAMADPPAVALAALEQALRHGALVLAGVAGGQGCARATRSAQLERTVRIVAAAQFDADERALARRLDPRRQDLEARCCAFQQRADARTKRCTLVSWAARAAARAEQRREQAATDIQRVWRAGYETRLAAAAAAADPPRVPSPYEQLRDLLVKYPQLQSSMYAAAASDASRPWMKSLMGAGEASASQDAERPRRQAARASVRKLERWLLEESSTREELLELLGDQELRRVALLRRLAACGESDGNSTGSIMIGSISGRAGAAELQEARTAEQSRSGEIRSRVRERSRGVHHHHHQQQQLSLSTSAASARTAWDSQSPQTVDGVARAFIADALDADAPGEASLVDLGSSHSEDGSGGLSPLSSGVRSPSSRRRQVAAAAAAARAVLPSSSSSSSSSPSVGRQERRNRSRNGSRRRGSSEYRRSTSDTQGLHVAMITAASGVGGAGAAPIKTSSVETIIQQIKLDSILRPSSGGPRRSTAVA
jgi:hypothetical protein